MYEYISNFERWKKLNTDYKYKYISIEKFVENCKKNCRDEECRNLCLKPILDIQLYNINMIKRLSIDVYELCSSKVQIDKDSNLGSEINKMKICCENLFRENEQTVKIQTLERLDDMIKFLNC